MQKKTKRPDVRLEPLLAQRLKEYAHARKISAASLIYNLIVNQLRQDGALSEEDLRIMRGA